MIIDVKNCDTKVAVLRIYWFTHVLECADVVHVFAYLIKTHHYMMFTKHHSMVNYECIYLDNLSLQDDAVSVLRTGEHYV